MGAAELSHMSVRAEQHSISCGEEIMYDTQAHPRMVGPAALAEAIEVRAHAKLRQAGYLELQNIACTFHHGTLALQGRVSSYYLLQMAQSLLSGLDGVREIDNRVVVKAAAMRADRCG
jgi:osmotically-inducible protein OsmY